MIAKFLDVAAKKLTNNLSRNLVLCQHEREDASFARHAVAKGQAGLVRSGLAGQGRQGRAGPGGPRGI